jgi:hypothetical protein
MLRNLPISEVEGLVRCSRPRGEGGGSEGRGRGGGGSSQALPRRAVVTQQRAKPCYLFFCWLRGTLACRLQPPRDAFQARQATLAQLRGDFCPSITSSVFHHQPINVRIAGAQVFLMEYTKRAITHASLVRIGGY